MNENTILVDIIDGKPRSRVLNLQNILSVADNRQRDVDNLPIIRNRTEWEQLVSMYEDITVDCGATAFPELNSLFTYVLSQIIETQGSGLPTRTTVLVDVMLRRKANI